LFRGKIRDTDRLAFGDGQFRDHFLKNVTRLTTDGDNGEAYFSGDGKKLIFQSSGKATLATRYGP